MSIDNLPKSEKDLINIAAKAGYLSVENDNLKVSLESVNTINIQPKGNIFGAKIKVENDGSIAPTLTFDTKKLREQQNHISPKDAIDEALEEFLENNNV